ncbi:uncharacterized protein VTP21DRAFT_9216 [Calcarisporiella thermophila]|uniref:uncharacterized protein n=1 Tax=Calcarisporiella thermophila TaxID=911321 RepID=UPI00374410E2
MLCEAIAPAFLSTWSSFEQPSFEDIIAVKHTPSMDYPTSTADLPSAPVLESWGGDYTEGPPMPPEGFLATTSSERADQATYGAGGDLWSMQMPCLPYSVPVSHYAAGTYPSTQPASFRQMMETPDGGISDLPSTPQDSLSPIQSLQQQQHRQPQPQHPPTSDHTLLEDVPTVPSTPSSTSSWAPPLVPSQITPPSQVTPPAHPHLFDPSQPPITPTRTESDPFTGGPDPSPYLTPPTPWTLAPPPSFSPFPAAPFQPPPSWDSPALGYGIAFGPLSGSPFPMPLAYHYRIPVVERPFKCDRCLQSFHRNHDLKRHEKIHLSVKPFNCDVCRKQFSRKDALKRHLMVKKCGRTPASSPKEVETPAKQVEKKKVDAEVKEEKPKDVEE